MHHNLLLLQQFDIEILQQGFDSTLPRNLPEKWLKILANCLERIIENRNLSAIINYPEHSFDIALISCAINHLLRAKNRYSPESPASVSDDKRPLFYHYCESYRMEIALESISRATDIHLNSATLETIFTNREVIVEHRH